MYKDFFTAPARQSIIKGKVTTKSAKQSLSIDQPKAGPSSPAPKSDPSARGVKFNENVSVKTIEARRNNTAERLALFKRLGMDVSKLPAGATITEEDEDEEVDWDMEKFDDIDGEGVPWPDDEDDGSTESDEGVGEDDDDDDDDDDDGDIESVVGTETIQRLKNDLFDDEDEASDAEGKWHSLGRECPTHYLSILL
jgi:hypothetical protein